MIDVNEFKLGGKTLAACMVGVGCGITAIPFYTHSLFVVAITSNMGWSRSDTQFGFSLLMVFSCLCAPIAGHLVDRYGGRRFGIASFLMANICFASLSMSYDIASYYFVWIMMAILGMGTLPIVWTYVISNWFDKSRGLALGLTLMGTGIAATLAPRYAAWLIEKYGWQVAYQGLAATALLIGLPVLTLLLKDRPKSKLLIDSTVQYKSGVTLGTAVKDYRFWVLGLSILGIALGVSGVISNLASLLVDKGYTLAEAGSLAGLIGISVIIGRIVTGLLFDRFWAPLVACIILILPAISCITLAGDFGPLGLAIAVFIVGLAAGAELDMLAFMSSRYFGLSSYGRIYALQYIFFAVGAGIAPTLFGWMRDSSGSYSSILNVSAVLFVICSMLLLTMGRYPTFKQPSPQG